MLGHFKLVVILTAGVTVFGESASPWRLAGMALALSGIVGYTALKRGLGDGWEGRHDVGGVGGVGGAKRYGG